MPLNNKHVRPEGLALLKGLPELVCVGSQKWDIHQTLIVGKDENGDMVKKVYETLEQRHRWERQDRWQGEKGDIEARSTSFCLITKKKERSLTLIQFFCSVIVLKCCLMSSSSSIDPSSASTFALRSDISSLSWAPSWTNTSWLQLGGLRHTSQKRRHFT